MNILVTGGAGFIGSVVSAHLLKAGHSVVVLDNLSKGHRESVPDKAGFIEGDIADTDLVKRMVEEEKIEAVMHFAALIEAGESMRDPGKYFENNVVKSHALIKTIVEGGVKLFVFSSTAAVYKSKDEPLAETDAIEPANVYGQTKRMIEEMLEWYAKVKGLRVGVLRYFNAAGASRIEEGVVRGEAHEPETHLIPNILQVPLGIKERVTVFGQDYPTLDGTNVRDYIHVDDLAQAHVKTLNALGEQKFDYEVFNLGNGQGFTNLQVLEAARKITGLEIPAEFGPRREGDAAILVAKSDKAKEVLDWQPQQDSLEEIVGSAWEWHRHNRNR
jgi:UDP-glucose 4-epimerase